MENIGDCNYLFPDALVAMSGMTDTLLVSARAPGQTRMSITEKMDLVQKLCCPNCTGLQQLDGRH